MNKEKLEECSKLLEDSMSVLQKDTELWKQFLQFATQFTYYRFRDQLLIYAQNQQATACATFAQWKKIGRYVRSGEHSIVLLDETGLKPKLRHVFDVMSTGPEKEFAYRPKPILSEEREEFAKQLSAVYAKENSSYFTDAQQWEGDLEHTLSQIALYMTQQYYGVSLEQAAEHSENGEIPTYYVATATSAMYLLLSKYGFEKEANQLDFSCMEQLDEKQFENVGTAASAILSRTARMIRQIHPQIQRETQTEKQPERSHENEERIDNRGYSQENHISSGGELYGTGHWTAGGRGGRTGTEKVRNDEKEVSGGEQSVAVREHGDARNTVSRDEEGGRSSRPDPGTDASEAGKGSRSDSGIEANESAGVGAQDGSLQSSGRGSDSGGTGVQLTLSDYLELRPTDRESVSESDTPKIIEQEKLYDISEKAGSETEEEQEAGGESPTASFMPKNEIPESEVVRVLQSGSGIENGKIRIAALFLSESDGKKRVDFLKEEYGIGGRTHYFEDGTHGWVDWDAKGILISKSYSSDAARLRLPWIQVEKRLGELIRYDQYLKPDEKEELSKIENKYGTLPLPMVRFEYPYEDRTQEPTESETQNFGLADDFLTVRETEDGYVVWDSMQEGIHTEPDGTIGGPYADKAQAQLHKYEFEKKILERSEQDKSHVLSEQKETQAAPEKEGVSESDTQKADGQEETETGISDSLIKPDQSIQSKPVPAQNFHITDDHIGEGGAKQKFRANMDAVNTLHKIEIENRNATAQEQEILSKYVGWGGLADAFDEKKDAWASEYSELKEVLTEEEYTAARESTLNAHYTSPVIIRGIYNALEQFGFQGGSILEPSMGIGNFFGMLPDSMKNSRLYGVELDSVSGRIAKKLYPNAQITVAGFETTNQHDFYDLAIGNVPFGNYKVNDRGYNRLGFSIHNYFFAKALDQIRPGGIMAFVTSHYTMDSKNPAARRYLSQRAELLGAIRLPDNAFRAARMAKISDPTYEVNVKALEQAQPKDLTASEIDVRLGATWIDAKYIEEFMYETFHTTYHQRRQIHVSFATVTGEWQISGKSTIYSGDVVAHAQYGTARMSAYEILEQTLNLRNVTVYDRVDDGSGNVKSVVNPKETMFAQQKQQTIKEAFQNWIWKDPFRREELEKTYNERFNSLRPAEFSGEHIHFVGMNPLIGLRTHQKNAVAHILYGGNTLLAHEVGAGKTYTMAAAAMESKRLGLCRKSLFVVPNHLTLQWANEFLHLYPAANLLVASKKDFEAANRKKFCARIATGDYDAIIIGHSQFERIPVSPERQEKILQSQLEEIEDAIQQSAWQRGQAFTVKQLEKTRKTIKQKLEKLRAEERKDNVVTFEQLGIDRLFVDEAHCYKNLFLYTKMRNVAGLSVSEAQKSSDMFMKCQYMDELTGGKGIIFATGTPVSNSMTELYTMMRYLQYGTLKEHGLTQFDAWASVFGETVTASELAPEGTGYRQKTRFAKFFNLPELMNLFKQAADIQTADQLKLPVPEADIQTVVVQPSDLQKEMVASLSERAAQIHNGAVDPSQDNMLKVTSDGRKIGLDQRLMNPLLPDDPNSKLNACVKNVLRIWEEGKENRLTQLIFCDNSTPKAGVFNVYDDVKEKLLAAGVPKEEVAFIHTADTEVKKKELFSKVRSGQVRILLGSTQKMGAGTNVQERLIAVHHLDVGWRPSDMTQRNGRIIRQGNMNPIVQVYNYVTEGTFDAYLWQTLENKQKFISQIMTSKSPVRSCEDVDEQVLSYAEVKALCAGDDRIKEKMDLEVEVARLRMLKAEHQSTKYRLEDQLLKILPEQIQKKTAVIESLEKDQKTAEQHPAMSEESISIDILGTTYTDRKEAAKALIETGKLCSTTQILQIGSYRGFELEGCVNVITAEIQIVVKGELAHPISLSSVGSVNLIRLDNVLQKLPEQIELEKGKLEALIQQQEDAKKQLQEPFGQENELREKTKRLEELSCELDVDSHGKPEVANANEESREKLKSHNQTRQLPPRQSRFSRFRQKKEEPEIDEELEYE